MAHVLTLVCLTRHLDQTSVVRANGVEVPLAGWRWLPYETWRMGLGSPVRPCRRSTAPPPGNATPPCATANVTVASRMQFEANAVMQRFTALSLQPLQPLIVDITFQSAVESVAAMPWLLPLSSDFANTSTTLLAIPDLDLPVQVTCHTISKACSAWAIMSCSPPLATRRSHPTPPSCPCASRHSCTPPCMPCWCGVTPFPTSTKLSGLSIFLNHGMRRPTPGGNDGLTRSRLLRASLGRITAAACL